MERHVAQERVAPVIFDINRSDLGNYEKALRNRT
jgi:hypothetical protein